MTSVCRAAAAPGMRQPESESTCRTSTTPNAWRNTKRLLGEPRSLTRAAQVGGRRPLDTASPGQQEFQALLLWCLFSPPRSLRWDTKGGRSFRAMQDYYSWVSPQPDYLATGWTVPARVASYLLPDLISDRDIDGGPLRFSGIPGLRVAGFTKQAICLQHLPTGGVLRLYGPRLR